MASLVLHVLLCACVRDTTCHYFGAGRAVQRQALLSCSSAESTSQSSCQFWREWEGSCRTWVQVHNGRGKCLVDLDTPPEAHKVHSTKVVQRSWYESNKHIFPANRWELFDELKHVAR